MTITLSPEERRLLQLVQAGVPVVPRPFDHLGRESQMEEARVLELLRTWKEQGLIRWLGAIFSTHALGYQSTLAAFSLTPDHITEAAGIISRHPGVSHNYQRDYEYNLWFTLAVPPQENLEAHLERLAQASGARKWINLPVVKTYKISLVLPVAEEGQEGRAPGATQGGRIYSITDEEKALIRILQEDWPLVPAPYQVLAGQWGSGDERYLIEKIRQWKEQGIIRRIAAILRHHHAGFTVNWMVAWQVQEKKIDEAGERAAQNPLVSHCYRRALAADWKYPLFTMIHARSEEEAQQAVDKLHRLLEPLDYKILPTVREFKKTRLKLFAGN
ncbi:MAG: Lrp/AsnC family transcriptional regulator [bacterium]